MEVFTKSYLLLVVTHQPLQKGPAFILKKKKKSDTIKNGIRLLI